MNDDADVSIETGSTNVYADLGFPDAAAMLRKSQTVSEMCRTIKTRGWTLETAATELQLDKSELYRITRGQFRSFSEAQLREWATRLTN